jgi:Fe-S-cluster-containing dehydrogenase component
MKKEYLIFVDYEKCDGCGDCVEACASIPWHIGTSLIFISEIDKPEGKRFFPILCMQCANPPCANACPTEAIKRREDLSVTLAPDESKCIGCQNCVLVCPFGASIFESSAKLSLKCDLCIDLKSREAKPACVKACESKGAIIFEDQTVIKDKIRREVAFKLVSSLPLRGFR